jgi:peptidoglycan/LPS O-acetylase OafA/YrhL
VRAIAACSILVFHTWLYSAPGEQSSNVGRLGRYMPDLAYGVILFFTLSGFLLYRPFAAAVLRDRPLPSLGRYLRNRALRILPAYWAILLLCAIPLGTALYWDSAGNLVNGRLLDPARLARAAFFVHDYAPTTLLLGIGPAWSLAVEVVFYCALPLLALLAGTLARRRTSRRGRRAAVLAPAALVLALGVSGKLAAAYLVAPDSPYQDWSQDWHSVLVRSFWCQADLFAFGMVMAVLRVDSEDGLLSLPRWWRPAAFAGAAVAYLVVSGSPDHQLSYSLDNTLVAMGCSLLLALVVLPAGAASSRFVRVLEARPLVAAGMVSYSIFLWHEPLIRLLDDHDVTLAGGGGFVVNLIIAGGVTGMASALTYRFVEAPALRLKFRRRSRTSERVPAEQVEAAP